MIYRAVATNLELGGTLFSLADLNCFKQEALITL